MSESVAAVRRSISEAVTELRLAGCDDTMRNALGLWKMYLLENKEYGLSAANAQWYRIEHDRIDFLLKEIFPAREEVRDG